MQTAERYVIFYLAIQKRRPRVGKKYTGELTYWFETGTEGLIWVLKVDENQSGDDLLYGDLVIIEKGDRLKIVSLDGNVIFDGVVRTDYFEGSHPYPCQWTLFSKMLLWFWRWLPERFRKLAARKQWLNGQPAACGYWIHWTQTGWKAEDWARLFVGRERYRAEIEKNSPDISSAA